MVSKKAFQKTPKEFSQQTPTKHLFSFLRKIEFSKSQSDI